MGCGSSNTVVINLDRTTSFYHAGEVVSGTVQLIVNDDKLEADEIDLNLIGEIGYVTKRTTHHAGHTGTHRAGHLGAHHSGNMHTETEYHHVPFLKTKYVFARPKPGEKELTYTQGQYSFPFQIQLPNHLPPTLGQPQAYPHVRYYVQMYIDKAWHKSNTRENRYITVFPYVNISQMPNCLTPTMFGNHNRKDIILNGNLIKIGYIPGEMVQGTLDITNPQQVEIKQILVTLMQHHQIANTSHNNAMTSCLIPGIVRRRDPRIVQQFGLLIPAGALAPSYQFDGGVDRPVSVHVDYVLKLVVEVEGMFTNFETLIPIVIGIEQNSQPPQNMQPSQNFQQPQNYQQPQNIQQPQNYQQPPNYQQRRN